MSATDSEPTDGQLEAKADLNEDRAKRCGWLVVAGLVIETALTGVFPAHEPKASNFRVAWIETWGPVLADVLVALGVYGEILFAGKARRIDGALRRRSNKRLEEATNRLADVEIVTATLHATAETAEERAAKAELETMRLRQQFGGRHISGAQATKLSAALRDKAASLDVLIEFQANDPEAFLYALELRTAITAAGIEKNRFLGNSYLSGMVFGVWLTASPEIGAPPILAALNEAGIVASEAKDVDLSAHLPRNEVAPNLYIFVGPKPPKVTIDDVTSTNPASDA